MNLESDVVVDDLENRPLYQYLETSGPGFVHLGLAHLNGFANEGEGSFFETRAFLGFRFEGDDGTHYGYAEINGNRVTDFEVLSYAYESEPDTPILTGAVPEPSTAFLLMMIPALAWRRRRSAVSG